MGLSLKNIGKKLIDQFNPLDNGKTFKNPQGNAPAQQKAGVAAPSAIQQLTHNGLTNAFGNAVVKPVTNTLAIATVDPFRELIAQATGNKQAQLAQEARTRADIQGSIPYQAAKGVIRGTQSAYNLGFKAPVLDIMGKTSQASRARTAGLQEFNDTTPGQLTRPIQYGIANMGKASKGSQREVGLDPDATGAQKFFADPVTGAITTYLGLKGGAETLGKVGERIGNVPKAGSVDPQLISPEPPKVAAQEVPKQKVAVRPDTQKTLNIKIAKVKDPVRKAELVMEKNARFPKPTEMGKDPNVVQRALTTINGYFQKLGDNGKDLAARNETVRDLHERALGEAQIKLRTVLSLKKKEVTQFWDTVDALGRGERPGRVSPKIADAIREWTQFAPQLRQEGMSVGLDIGDLGRFYLPRTYKALNKDPNGFAKNLVKSGKAADMNEAYSIIENMRSDINRPYGNLEKSRAGDAPGYEKTHDALINYLSRSYERIAKASQFGAKNEILNDIRARLANEGHDVSANSTFEKYLKAAHGDVDYNTAGQRAASLIRQVNAYRSLQTAQISNIGQGTNTAAIAGIRNTAKAYLKTIMRKREDADFVTKTGVINDHALSNLASQNISERVNSNLSSPGFKSIEKVNRSAAALAGREYLHSLYDKAQKGNRTAERLIREVLEVKGEIKGKPTFEQEIQAARSIVKKAQFKIDAIDLPYFMSTPVGKTATQFRSFTVKQTEFMVKQVLGEARKGNFAPLARFLVVGVPTGAAVSFAKNAAKGKFLAGGDDQQTWEERILDGLSAVGAGGLPAAEISNLVTGAQHDNTTGAVAGALGGPTASTLIETTQNIDKGLKGEGYTKLKKQGVRNIPVVGKVGANLLFPSKATADTERFFGALDKATGTLKGDKKAQADFQSYLARSKNPENGKTIQLSPAESIDNSRSLFANDKLRHTVQQFEKSANKTHSPQWDLPDDKLKTYLQYKAQYTGDAAKTTIENQNPWIQDVTDKVNAFYKKLPKGNGKGSEANAQTPEYPKFDDKTTKLLATYSAADDEQKSAILQGYGGELSAAFNQIAGWTNQMRKAEGAPEKNDYPVADERTQQIMNFYNTLPEHDGSKGGNATRYAWGKANPEAYGKMQDYLSKVALYSLISHASLAQYKGTEPDQKLLASIKNVGKYDIATMTDEKGNKTYSFDPALAAQQNNAGSSFGSPDYALTKFAHSIASSQAGAQRSSPKLKAPKVSYKKGGGTSKRKVSRVNPSKKKVALKRSKV